jgi:hypothetical protein
MTAIGSVIIGSLVCIFITLIIYLLCKLISDKIQLKTSQKQAQQAQEKKFAEEEAKRKENALKKKKLLQEVAQIESIDNFLVSYIEDYVYALNRSVEANGLRVLTFNINTIELNQSRVKVYSPDGRLGKIYLEFFVEAVEKWKQQEVNLTTIIMNMENYCPLNKIVGEKLVKLIWPNVIKAIQSEVEKINQEETVKYNNFIEQHPEAYQIAKLAKNISNSTNETQHSIESQKSYVERELNSIKNMQDVLLFTQFLK